MRATSAPTRRGSARHRILCALVLCALLWIPGLARAAQAHLEIDARQLKVGETVALRLVVMGGAADALPRLPEVAPLRFSYQGPQRQIVSVNLRTTSVITYTWAATAVREGRAIVGPLTITVDGAPLRVSALEVEVLAPAQGQSGGREVLAALEPTPAGLAEGQPVPLWAGQAVVYRFSFAYADAVADARWTQPDFAGFTPVPGVEQAQREYPLQRGGRTWTVHEVDVALLAGVPGEREIGPALITAQIPVESPRRRRGDPFEDFFGRSMFTETRSEVIASRAVPVLVRPLPAEGRPASFPGLVGTFEADATLAATEVRAGESVTLTVTLRGAGSLAGVRMPPAPPDPGFRAYDDDPEVTAELSGRRLESTAVLRRALVPVREGALELPPVDLSWFDPEAGEYRTYRSSPLTLTVLPGETGAAELADFSASGSVAQQEVAAIGEDILPIHTDIVPRDRRFRTTRPLPLLALGLPGLVLAWQVGRDVRLRGGARSRRLAAVRARLAALPVERAARLAALEAGFREAAGLALGIPAAAVEPIRLREGLGEPLGEAAATLYQRLEGARFAGADVGDLERAVLDMVPRLLGRAR